jgi:hypothetical protein
MKENTVERVRSAIRVINLWNSEKRPNEIAREMLTPRGHIFIKPGTFVEKTIHVKRSDIKRAVLRIITENLISQNPPRDRTIK